MDSAFSWFALLILVNIGLVLAIRRGMKERRQDREANDRFFHGYDHNHTLNR